MKNTHIEVGTFGVFPIARVKNVNGSWLAETWNTIEELASSEWFIGIYNGFDLVTWALNRGFITTQEFRSLYTMLLDPSVHLAEIDWKFISPVLYREMLQQGNA